MEITDDNGATYRVIREVGMLQQAGVWVTDKDNQTRIFISRDIIELLERII